MHKEFSEEDIGQMMSDLDLLESEMVQDDHIDGVRSKEQKEKQYAFPKLLSSIAFLTFVGLIAVFVQSGQSKNKK